MKERLEWMLAVLKGLGVAVTTDLNVFLLALAGGLLGGRRGLGKALLAYVVFRRADDYGHLYASKMDKIALVMAESIKPAAIWLTEEHE